jgi:hypothetical protein
MKRYFRFIIFIVLFAPSCKQVKTDQGFDNIELIEYYWRYSKIPSGDHWLRGTLYAIINNKGECKIIDKPDSISRYKIFHIPDSVIKAVILSMSKMPLDSNIHPPFDKPEIYDGPTIRIIYSSNGINKNVSFLDDEKYSESNCIALYKLVVKLNEMQDYKTFSDTTKIKENRNKQLEIIYDEWYQFLRMNIDSSITEDSIRNIF